MKYPKWKELIMINSNHITIHIFALLLVSSLSLYPQATARENSQSKINNIKLTPTSTFINPALQSKLIKYLKRKKNPIAAIVLVEISSGKIVAIVEGLAQKTWYPKTHTALYNGFPAASIFKIITTIAALEDYSFLAKSKFYLSTNCQKINPRGTWLAPPRRKGKKKQISFALAFASSCNSLYAKIGMNHIGLKSIGLWAQRLGWQKKLGTDFKLASSNYDLPKASRSDLASAGRVFSGFGKVYLSPAHGAWLALLVGNLGETKALRLFRKHGTKLHPPKRIFSQQTARELLYMMHKTVRNGTSAQAFSARRYKKIKNLAGGKTGTLSLKTPKGQASWFIGVYPYKKPQVALAALVVNKKIWHIKGSHLAAETFYLWEKLGRRSSKTIKLVESKSIKKTK